MGSNEQLPCEDLRDWIDRSQAIGEVVNISGADPNLEVGALDEYAFREFGGGPAILLDQLKGYAPTHRILLNQLTSVPRIALTLNLPIPGSKMELVKTWRNRVKSVGLVPTQRVDNGPVTENIQDGPAVDLLQFPAPLWHEEDGGRYLGTGSLTITRDPETGWVNVGTYRAMVHGRDKLGLYISRIKHGRRHLEKYWASGKPCPVVLSFGQDPLLFLTSSMPLPADVNELEYAGGIRGCPVKVMHGELTGLPIPANAEIVVEGEIYPDESLPEGPFGEWTGYYASATRNEPVVNVKRVMYRNQPIVSGEPPLRPPNAHTYWRSFFKSALIWNDMESAGIPDVRGVWLDEAGGANLLLVVSIKQRYPGHAFQAAVIASQCGAAITLNRYIVVVDDDINPSDRDQVLWAICTRSDPERSIQILHRCFSSALDPAISADQNRHHSRAMIDACKPWERLHEFPREITTNHALVDQVKAKWGHTLAAYARSKSSLETQK